MTSNRYLNTLIWIGHSFTWACPCLCGVTLTHRREVATRLWPWLRAAVCLVNSRTAAVSSPCWGEGALLPRLGACLPNSLISRCPSALGSFPGAPFWDGTVRRSAWPSWDWLAVRPLAGSGGSRHHAVSLHGFCGGMSPRAGGCLWGLSVWRYLRRAGECLPHSLSHWISTGWMIKPCPLALGMSRSFATCTEICTPRRSPCLQGGVPRVADALLGCLLWQGRLRWGVCRPSSGRPPSAGELLHSP